MAAYVMYDKKMCINVFFLNLIHRYTNVIFLKLIYEVLIFLAAGLSLLVVEEEEGFSAFL